ncbi:MAG: hypothetical protein JW990_01590, partial [Thermoleophilia bacterium]|nr:hypothetical protein [Thermoleophilia bacterium]
TAGERDWSQEAAGGLQLFAVATIPESDLGLAGDLNADAVVLLNVGRISQAAAERLEQYHAEGGNILVVLGDRVDPRTYNTQILPRLGALRLENVVGDLTSETFFALRPAVAGHEIFDGFPLAPGEALSSARFRRLLDVRLGTDSRVLAEFTGERPALIEEPGLLLFTSAFDTRWSDFPTSASYLPFLHRTLLHLILEGRVARRQPTVGDLLSHPIPAEMTRSAFSCLGPEGLRLPVEVSQSDRGAVLKTAPVPEPGFYHLMFSEPGAAGADGNLETYAVNVDAQESDLSALPAEELPLIFGADAVQLAPEEELSRQVLETRYGRELWKQCLALAFLFLLAESAIGRGRLRP